MLSPAESEALFLSLSVAARSERTRRLAEAAELDILPELDDVVREADVVLSIAPPESARTIAYEWWPTSALADPLTQELALPSHFESVAKMVSELDVESTIICGPDPRRHIDAIRKCIEAGFDHVYVHQIGKEQEGFFKFYESEILPEFGQKGILAA